MRSSVDESLSSGHPSQPWERAHVKSRCLPMITRNNSERPAAQAISSTPCLFDRAHQKEAGAPTVGLQGSACKPLPYHSRCRASSLLMGSAV
jgi:hypothetical protein